MPTLILVHIGNHFPTYINDCIAQINAISNIAVHVLVDRIHISSCKGKFRVFPLDSIPMDDLHITFEGTCILDANLRSGFWKYATKRFFYLYSHIKREALEDVFHIENDNLIYVDFTKYLSAFQQKSMWCIIDAEDRCIPGFLYFKDESILERLNNKLITCAQNNINDMKALAQFQKENVDVGCLPIINNYCDVIPLKYYEHVNLFDVLFDGAAVGQYIGGVDPQNQKGNSIGFINETSIFKCNKVSIEWKHKKPYMNSKALVNLHIHSKNLKQWMT